MNLIFIIISFTFELNAFNCNTVKIVDNEVENANYEPLNSDNYEKVIAEIDRKIVYNQNMSVRYFKLQIIIDYPAFKLLNEDIDKTRDWTLKLTNMVDALYQHANLRVYLALLDIITNEHDNPIKLDSNTDTAKDVLVKYRNYIKKTKNDQDFKDLLSASVLITASGWSDNSIKGLSLVFLIKIYLI